MSDSVSIRLRKLGGQNVGVTAIHNGDSADSEKSTTSGSELVVTALEVVDGALGEHGVVLNLGLSQSRGVASDDHELGLTLSQGLDGGLVTKGVLSGLDSKTELGVDVIAGLLRLGGLC